MSRDLSVMSEEHCQQANVHVIGACYYVPPEVFDRKAFAIGQMLQPRGNVKGISAVNIRPAMPAIKAMKCSWTVASGPFLDISAYASGFDSATTADAYILFNDTLFLRHPWKLIIRRIRNLLPSLVSMPVATGAGEVHPTTDLLINDQDNPARRHLSTFCFALNFAGFRVFREIARTLPPDYTFKSTTRWIEEMIDTYPALRVLLHVHLFGPTNPWSWKQRTGGMTTDDLVLRKAVTVIVEYLLSVQLTRAGGTVMPINLGVGYRLAKHISGLMHR